MLSVYSSVHNFEKFIHKLSLYPVWARGRCRISPPRFLAECCKRQLNQGSFVLLYFRLSTFSDLYWVCYLYFHVLFCLSVSVKWLAVQTASEITYTVSSGALNSTLTNYHCNIWHAKSQQCHWWVSLSLKWIKQAPVGMGLPLSSSHSFRSSHPPLLYK